MNSQIKMFFILLIFVFFPVNAIAAGISISSDMDGKAIFVIGKVQVRNSEGEISLLKRGSAINSGDIIITSSKSQVQIKMIDGTLLAIRPDSEFKISNYQYEQSIDSDESIYNLVKGGFRSITGKMGKTKKSSYAGKTVVGTIGIRGTDFSARICESNCGDQEDGLYVGVMQGGVVLSNDSGSLDVSPGDFGFMPDSGVEPIYLDEMPGDLLFAKSNNENTKTETIASATDTSISSQTSDEETLDIITPVIASKDGNEIDLALLTEEEMELLAEPKTALPSIGSATYTAVLDNTTLNSSADIASGSIDLDTTTLIVDFAKSEVNVSYEIRNVITSDAGVLATWTAGNTQMTYDQNGNYSGNLTGASSDTMVFPKNLTGTTSGSLVDTTPDIVDAPSTVMTDFMVTDGTNTFDGTVDFSSPTMN